MSRFNIIILFEWIRQKKNAFTYLTLLIHKSQNGKRRAGNQYDKQISDLLLELIFQIQRK